MDGHSDPVSLRSLSFFAKAIQATFGAPLESAAQKTYSRPITPLDEPSARLRRTV